MKLGQEEGTVVKIGQPMAKVTNRSIIDFSLRAIFFFGLMQCSSFSEYDSENMFLQVSCSAESRGLSLFTLRFRFQGFFAFWSNKIDKINMPAFRAHEFDDGFEKYDYFSLRLGCYTQETQCASERKYGMKTRTPAFFQMCDMKSLAFCRNVFHLDSKCHFMVIGDHWRHF